MAAPKRRTRAFTFVEVMIALAIVSISLLALLRLYLISACMVDKARIMTCAVFLADAKIAETLAGDFPQEEGTRSGVVENNGLKLSWKTRVENSQPAQLDADGVTGLRKVVVDVGWKQGTHPKYLRLSTYVADRKLP